VGACLVGLYPDVLISIKKVWDTNITIALMMSIFALLLTILRRGLSTSRAVSVGLLWGLSINVRPNFPALVLPIAFTFWCARPSDWGAKRVLSSGALALGFAFLVVALVSAVAHGSFFVPGNGPYNLYAGANPFTQQALLASLNAEPSIYPALRSEGFGSDVNVYSPALRPYYVRASLRFVREHPLGEVKLFGLKLLTLLRPDTKIHPWGSPGGALKTLEALTVPCWLIALLISRNCGWANEDWLVFTFVLAYIAPFVITNSDPRFRVPLDILVLTHGIYRVSKLGFISSRLLTVEGVGPGRLSRVAK
jgi:hypothetical protein